MRTRNGATRFTRGGFLSGEQGKTGIVVLNSGDAQRQKLILK